LASVGEDMAIEEHIGAERQRSQGPSPRQPEVSFIVAALNVAPYVEAAVTSALQQRDVDIEVIVVDDGSRDGTAEIVAGMANGEPRLKLLRRETAGGPSVARNIAMDAARGTWMAILDADDVVAPDRSRRLLDLAAVTAADLVADNFERFVEGGQAHSTMIAGGATRYGFFVDLATFIRRNALFARRANLGYIKPMFRTDFVRRHGIRHREDVYIGEDYHFCLACLLAGARFVVTSESFYRYRIREGSLSWRLRPDDIERLLCAHADLKLEDRFRADAEVTRALRTYLRALQRAKTTALIIAKAKSGGWAQAFASAAVHPEVWVLLGRFASEALRKRLPSALALPKRGA
jgi:succinoglycan biosynthesis protein ExoO